MIKTISASEFCHRVFDGTHATPKPVSEGRPLVTSKNIVGGRLDLGDIYNISQSDYEDIQRRSYVSQWDVLFSMIGSVGEVYLERNPHIEYAIKNVGVFSCLDEQRAKWLYYFLKSPIAKRFIKNQMSGAVQKFLGLGTLRSFPIPEIVSDRLPGIELLHNLDAKIELNNRINAELEGMAKLLYDYWFVQFDFPMTAAQAAALGKPHLTGHPYRASGGKMIYNETLKREIPEGWTDGSLEKLGKIIGGSTPSTEVPEYFSTEGTPWITPKDLSDNIGNRFIQRGDMGVSEKGIKAASLKLLPAGTVLMSSRAPIGYLAIALNPVTTNQGFKSFVPENEFTTEYIYFTLKHFMKLIQANASGSTFKEISGGTLKAVKIHLPPAELVKKFTEFSSSLSSQQSILERQNQELTQLRDWLLPMLMNGQVTVGTNER
jgi:type I restriction enzyme S subunit